MTHHASRRGKLAAALDAETPVAGARWTIRRPRPWKVAELSEALEYALEHGLPAPVVLALPPCPFPPAA